MLHDDRVAGEDRGDDAVDRREEGIVPRRQVEHDAEGLAHDAPFEARRGRQDHVGQRALRDGHHVPCPGGRPPHLAAGLRDGLAHHARDALGDRLGRGLHRFHRSLAECDPLGEGRGPPRPGLRAGTVQDGVDGLVVRQLDLARDLSSERVVDFEAKRAFGVGHGRVSLPRHDRGSRGASAGAPSTLPVAVFARASLRGSPSKTIRPPLSPASGPSSITQSALAITSG